MSSSSPFSLSNLAANVLGNGLSNVLWLAGNGVFVIILHGVSLSWPWVTGLGLCAAAISLVLITWFRRSRRPAEIPEFQRAARALEHALGNILDRDLHLALDSTHAGAPIVVAGAEHEHAPQINEVLYQHANVLARLALLDRRQDPRRFSSKRKRDAFWKAVPKFRQALGSSDLPVAGAGPDKSVLRQQQNLIADATINDEADPPRPMTRPNFFRAVTENDPAYDPTFVGFLKPLREFLDGIEPDNKRGNRLAKMRHALNDMIKALG